MPNLNELSGLNVLSQKSWKALAWNTPHSKGIEHNMKYV